MENAVTKKESSTARKKAFVSAFIITFNEEENIADCLKSLNFCDEVLVIDSFSTDSTVAICEEHRARVIQREWPGYKNQKAFGLEQCVHPWVLNVDADERVSPELRAAILEVLESADKDEPGVVEGYEVNRVVHYMDRWWRRGGWYPEYRLRLFQKSAIKWGGMDPHEKPICSGSVRKLPGELHHYTYKDFDDQVRRLHKYAKLMASQEYEAGKRASVFSLLLNPSVRFFKFYFLKQGWREGVAGLIVAILEAYYTFLKYVFIWEQSYKEQQNNER